MPALEPALNWVKILFPLLFLIAFNIGAIDQRIYHLSRMLAMAERDQRPTITAASLDQLRVWQPWRVDLLEQAGQAQYRLGNYEGAITALEKAAESQPLALASQVAMAESYRQVGRFREAAGLWHQINWAGNEADLFALEVDAWRSAGEIERVIGALQDWQAAEPGNAGVAYNLGLFLSAQRSNEALAAFNEAARLDSRYTNARDAMQRAYGLAALNEDEGYQATVIGRGLASLGEWALAERCFLAAVEANPEYAEAWALLGETRSQLGGDGSADLLKAISINPDSVMAHALLALALGRTGQWDDAIAQIQQAAELEPERAVWRIELGHLTAEKGDLIAAREEFDKAIQLEPSNAQAWYALASFCYQYGVELEESGEPAARKAIELDEQDAAAHDLLGAILVQAGEEEEGEQAVQQALELDDSLASAYLHLGEIYLKRGEMDLAYENFSQAAKLGGQGEAGILANRALQRFFSGEVTP